MDLHVIWMGREVGGEIRMGNTSKFIFLLETKGRLRTLEAEVKRSIGSCSVSVAGERGKYV